MDNVISIDGGVGYALALKKDGTVWGWGYNNYNSLGCNIKPSSNVPVQVPNVSNIIKISAGNNFSLALRTDGNILWWGYYWPTARQLQGLSNAVEMSAGDLYGIVIKNDGTVWTWGYFNSYTLTQVSGLNLK